MTKLDMLKKTNNGPAMQTFEQSAASPLEIIFKLYSTINAFRARKVIPYNQGFSYKESYTLQ